MALGAFVERCATLRKDAAVVTDEVVRSTKKDVW